MCLLKQNHPPKSSVILMSEPKVNLHVCFQRHECIARDRHLSTQWIPASLHKWFLPPTFFVCFFLFPMVPVSMKFRSLSAWPQRWENSIPLAWALLSTTAGQARGEWVKFEVLCFSFCSIIFLFEFPLLPRHLPPPLAPYLQVGLQCCQEEYGTFETELSLSCVKRLQNISRFCVLISVSRWKFPQKSADEDEQTTVAPKARISGHLLGWENGLENYLLGGKSRCVIRDRYRKSYNPMDLWRPLMKFWIRPGQ